MRESFEGHVGVPLLEGYGLTEATCASARGYVEHPRPGSVGKRLPYQRMRVVRDVDGAWHDVETGGVGTLVISGPTVFPGYVAGRDATGWRLDPLGTVRDGWLDTGDLARGDRLAGSLCPNVTLLDGKRLDDAPGHRTLVRRGDPPPDGCPVVDVAGHRELEAWMGRAAWVRLRPDGVVAESGAPGASGSLVTLRAPLHCR